MKLIPCLVNIKENKDKIPKIISDYKLTIKLDESHKIVYEEEKTKEILDLLLDHYVTSALTDKKAIAKALDYEGDGE